MDVLYARCAGLDVHKTKVLACVLVTPERGAPTKTVRTFGTLADEVLALGDWLAEQGVTHVALETRASIGSRSGTCWKTVSPCCWSTLSTCTRCLGARPMFGIASG